MIYTIVNKRKLISALTERLYMLFNQGHPEGYPLNLNMINLFNSFCDSIYSTAQGTTETCCIGEALKFEDYIKSLPETETPIMRNNKVTIEGISWGYLRGSAYLSKALKPPYGDDIFTVYYHSKGRRNGTHCYRWRLSLSKPFFGPIQVKFEDLIWRREIDWRDYDFEAMKIISEYFLVPDSNKLVFYRETLPDYEFID